jgi:hypothetical protein
VSGGTTQSAAGSQFRHNAFVREMANRRPGEVKSALTIEPESGQAVYAKLPTSIVDFVSTCLLSVLILRYPSSRIVESFDCLSIDVSGCSLSPCILLSCSMHARTCCRARCWEIVMVDCGTVVNTELKLTPISYSYFIYDLCLSAGHLMVSMLSHKLLTLS